MESSARGRALTAVASAARAKEKEAKEEGWKRMVFTERKVMREASVIWVALRL